MKYAGILAIAISALGLLACPMAANAAQPGSLIRTDAGSVKPETVRYVRKRRPLSVDIYSTRRRVGGYSYSASDVSSTYSRSSPPPYLDVRQTPGGPFDSGFFFDSGIGPRGGFSPYMH
jgi:hypothetical protein